KYLELLINFIKISYKYIVKCFILLVYIKKITYNLLPDLFKANSEIYTTYYSTSVLRCFKYNYREERIEPNGSKFFYIKSYYIDFNGNMFREASI
ncbi:hypothetical protein K469DRAFT_551235, partial [Zopfia rhizophila CBS 207.26]